MRQPGILGEMVAQQRGYYQQIHQTFSPLPVWDAPYRAREVIGVQALINISVALCLVPTKGLPLPLVSYGGTSALTTLLALGLLLNVNMRRFKLFY